MPKAWYNLRADMKEQPDPMLNPATGKPATEEDLYPVFCKALAHQEMDSETRYVEIPEPIQDFTVAAGKFCNVLQINVWMVYLDILI